MCVSILHLKNGNEKIQVPVVPRMNILEIMRAEF